jgi:ABC-type sugar transport system substrate-binding protein
MVKDRYIALKFCLEGVMNFLINRYVGVICLSILLVCFPVFADETNDAITKTSVGDAKIKVVFLNPAGISDSYFWSTCSDLMQSAATQLDMDVKIAYAERSQLKINKQAIEALNAEKKPDFIIMQNMKSTAVDIMKEANKKNVKVFMFNSGLTDKERQTYGNPREQYKNWIGQMLPDDESAGYDLADILVREAKQKGLVDQQGKVQMLALGGTVSDTSAIEREKGLLRYVAEHKTEVVLHRRHALPGNWEGDTAAKVFEVAFGLFPSTTVVWNANDTMALGVLNMAKTRLGKTPGKDLLIGGIDWDQEALKAIESGELTTSIGGHFAECAWVMVMLYDYAKGADFETDEGVSMKSQFNRLTSANLSKINYLLINRSPEKINQIDFLQFSKIAHPQLLKYRFDLDRILEQLE